MAQELIVHIGTPKAGSSSLQRALHDGAFTTGDVRVAYPDRLSEADLAQALARGRENEVAKRMGRIQHWLSTTDADVFALSSEHFVAVPAETFELAVRRHLPSWSDRARVVCYLRPHDARLVSAFTQQRKSGAFLGSMDDFIRVVQRGNRFQHADRLEAWHAVYGDRLVVRFVSPAALVGGEVVADFLHVATSGAPTTVRAERLNPSLTAEALALLGIVHRALRAGEVPDRVAQRIGKRIAADLGAAGIGDCGHRLTLSAPEAETVETMFAQDATRLDAMFFPETRPFAEGLRGLAASAPPEAPSLRPGAYLDAAARKAIRADASALAAVCAEHGRPWVAQYRAAKGYRSDPAAVDPESVTRVEVALTSVVACLVDALRDLP